MKTFNRVSISGKLEKIFSILFFVSFSLILLNVIFNKYIYTYNTFNLLLSACLYLVFILFCGYFIYKHRQTLSKYFWGISIIAGLIHFIVLIIIAFPLRFAPIFDLEAIYQGAIELAEGRSFSEYTSNTCHTDYFYIFPNNLGSMAFLAAIFKLVSIFGIKDYFIVATIFNSIMCVATMILSSYISKKLFGVTAGLCTIIFFLTSPPFYFIGPVFYTDSLSLLFPVLSFFLFLKGEESTKLNKKIGLYIACALACTVGALIKMTVLIFAIAVLIYFILYKKWKDLAIFTIAIVSVFAILLSSFNAWIYSSHLDKAKAEQTNTPVYYWIDLAFHGNGGYNNNIYKMSRNEPDPEIRKQILKNDIKKAIDELGTKGVYNLFEIKSARAFGDGTYALSDFLDDRPSKINSLHKFITYDGEEYDKYSTLATAIFLSIQLLMVLSAALKKKEPRIIITQLSVFGIMVFLLFWEINSRYITTFIPFIFISAIGGLSSLLEILNKQLKIKTNQKEKAVTFR